MHYFAKIKGIKQTDQNTELLVTIPGEKLGRKITKYKIDGKDAVDAELRINDGRVITIDQRKKIYATIRDISVYTGDDPEYLKEYLKYDYCAATGEEHFSLSNCSITTAKEFINHIIDFILKHNIPLTDEALKRTDDIDRYLFLCIKYRRCCITGRANAEIHHVVGSRVGMGSNRNKISHSNKELIPLSRYWHKRVHAEGEYEIFKEHKVYGIKVDDKTLKDLNIKNDEIW